MEGIARLSELAGYATAERKSLNNIKNNDQLVAADIGYVKICENPKNLELAYEIFANIQLEEIYGVDKSKGVAVEKFASIFAQRYISSLRQMYMGSAKQGVNSKKNIEENVKSQIPQIETNVTEFAKMIDTDADGVISSKELAAFEQKMDKLDGKADGTIINGSTDIWFEQQKGYSIFAAPQIKLANEISPKTSGA